MSTQSSSGRSASKIVLAAGGVLWRPGYRESAAEIAVIHRPRYDDWSLPKGKVDPGETEPVTAVREVFEETGHHVRAGPPNCDGELSDRATHEKSAVLVGT